jgi:hypothetical protein
MRENLKKLIAGLAVAMLVPFGSVHADPITGLFNTGVGNGGLLLTDGTADAHYVPTTGPSWNAMTDATNPPGNPFPGAWLSNGGPSSVSSWIGLEPVPNNVPGTTTIYTLTLTFDLTGFDPNTASFDGRFRADDSVRIFLNSGSNLVSPAPSPNTFSSWGDFNANSGFVSGLNTLVFEVSNTGFGTATNFPTNPVGLRVEFETSSVAAIPEPEIYAMLAAGLGLMGFIARRRRQQLAAAA